MLSFYSQCKIDSRMTSIYSLILCLHKYVDIETIIKTIFLHVKMIQLWTFRYLNFWMTFSAILSDYMTLNEMKWNKLNDLREKLRMCWEIKAAKISGSMPLQVTTVSMKILSHSIFRKWNWISLFCVCLCTLCFFQQKKKWWENFCRYSHVLSQFLM